MKGGSTDLGENQEQMNWKECKRHKCFVAARRVGGRKRVDGGKDDKKNS